ncbi:MAG: class I SAM-dependent methyltransferase, partial [Chloroflexota bacterium]
AGPGVQLEEVTSDAFFAELPATAAFDLILLDGLHTFEQTYRDLCNALMHMHRSTVILIDGTRPSDPYASVPDPQLARRLRDIDAVAGGAWQGDVFKVVYALHDFHLELDYRTIVGPGLPQTLVWRSVSMERLPRFGSLGAIDRLTYFDMLDQWEVMQACPEDEALGRCMNALSAHAG